MAISWHRGDTPGLPTEPWNGGIGGVPPWWGVRKELEGFLGFPKLRAWWFSAPSFLELSGFCLWFTPSSELRGCLDLVFPQFGSQWLPTLSSPRIQGLGLSTFRFP